MNKQGILSVTWDVEPESFRNVMVSPASIANYVLHNVKPGSIVLLHVLGSSNEMSRDSIPLIINGLRKKGFQLVGLSSLLKEAEGSIH